MTAVAPAAMAAVTAVGEARAAQAPWAATPLDRRLACLRRLRLLIAANVDRLTDALGPRAGRHIADTLATEIAPFADAIRFLERCAPKLLRPRRLGWRGRPLWLADHAAEIRREPLGVVLVIGPSNYPLMLPGIQAVQALAAGNAVVVKPGAGGGKALEALAALAVDSGIDPRLLRILSEAPEAAEAAIAAGVDKVVLTGGVRSGRAVLAALADRLVPATMELSGSDAVFVLPGADLDLTARALAWGLTLNAGATCIAPRRVFVPRALAAELERKLQPLVARLAPAPAPAAVVDHAAFLVAAAIAAGARAILPWSAPAPGAAQFPPAVLADASPDMTLLHEDVFVPVLSLVAVDTMDDALAANAACPYALGASVFGPAAAAQALARRIRAGVVSVNDLIAPTADPRLPFGGFGRSGFGRTRGGDGLLAMTEAKAVTLRHGKFRPHYAKAAEAEEDLLRAYMAAVHGTGWRRARGALDLVRALMRLARRGRAGKTGDQAG